MNSQKQKPATPWPLIILFLILSAGELVVGFLYYRYQREHMLIDSAQELSAIADLKVRQLSQWRLERISDGNSLSQNISSTRQFLKLLGDERNSQLRYDLRGTLKALVDNYDYSSALFVDRNMQVKLFYPDRDTVVGDFLRKKLPEAIENGKVELTDVHEASQINYMHMDLIVPLKKN